MKLQFFILFVLFFVSSVLIGQTTISTDSIFQSIINNPKTELNRKTHSNNSGNVIKEFYELKNQRNEWTAFKEYYPNEKLNELGVYLNGHPFGTWTIYDSIGNVISIIDYSIPKQLVGQNQIHANTFQKTLKIGDSILSAHFDTDFIKYIRLHASRSYWYSQNNSGSWFDTASDIPKEFILRYSIVINDTLYFTPIELKIHNQKSIKVESTEGIPDTQSFKFNIDYENAMKIAKSKGYGEIHKTAFKESEFMNLIFVDKNYYWVISKISEDLWQEYENSNGGRMTANGETLYINCLTGEINEKDFEGIIFVD